MWLYQDENNYKNMNNTHLNCVHTSTVYDTDLGCDVAKQRQPFFQISFRSLLMSIPTRRLSGSKMAACVGSGQMSITTKCLRGCNKGDQPQVLVLMEITIKGLCGCNKGDQLQASVSLLCFRFHSHQISTGTLDKQLEIKIQCHYLVKDITDSVRGAPLRHKSTEAHAFQNTQCKSVLHHPPLTQEMGLQKHTTSLRLVTVCAANAPQWPRK